MKTITMTTKRTLAEAVISLTAFKADAMEVLRLLSCFNLEEATEHDDVILEDCIVAARRLVEGGRPVSETQHDIDEALKGLTNPVIHTAHPKADKVIRSLWSGFTSLSAENERLRAELDGWIRIVGEIAASVALPEVIRATGSARDMIAYFKNLRDRAEKAEAALASTKETR